MTDEELSALLANARNYLDITWEDSEGDKKLLGILQRGMKYLGDDLDFTAEDSPRALLFDYARYVRSNALDEFARNYQHELLLLQMEREAREAIAAEEAGGDDTAENNGVQ